MEINNRTVRLLERPIGLPKKNIWSLNQENFDLELRDQIICFDFPNNKDM